MDVSLSDEQELLRRSARELLERECPMSLVREAIREPSALDGLWKQLSDLGWTGLAVPEAHGGSGLGWLELALLAEPMGRVLLPAPYLSTAVLTAPLVAALARPDQAARWLPPLADGSRRAALACLEAEASWEPARWQCRAEPVAPGHRLSGEKRFVEDACLADWILVPARAPEGLGLFLVEREAPGLEVQETAWTDPTRRVARVRLDGVQVTPEARLGEPGSCERPLEGVLDGARAVLACQMVGGAERALELAVAYAKEREQFGRPIGAFQAIQHRCAEMLVRVESARSAALYAAWCVAAGAPGARTAALLAKALCSEAFVSVAADAIQIHGGLGFTWEQDPQLFYKRAKADELYLGSPAWCREQAARAVVDRGEPLP